MRVVAVIQARLGSERLPRKVLENVGGQSVLDRLLQRLQNAHGLDDLVFAFPESDRELFDWADGAGASWVAGSEDDVLGRYVRAARATSADAVVRITADCPLLDPALVTDLVQDFRTTPCDYAFVDGFPRGVGDVEIVGTRALILAGEQAVRAWHREHVITYVTDNPDAFELRVAAAPAARRRPDLRVCIDASEDLEAVRQLVALSAWSDDAGVDEVIRLLDAHPEIRAINAHVQQRS